MAGMETASGWRAPNPDEALNDGADASPGASSADTRLPRMRLQTLFSLLAGGIVLLSVGTVIALSILNTRVSLVRSLATEYDLIVGDMTGRIEELLSEIAGKHEELAEWIGDDPALHSDDARLATALRAAVAASAQTSALALARPDGTSVRFDGKTDKTVFNDLHGRADITLDLSKARARGADNPTIGWSAPFYSPSLGRTIIVYKRAVWSNGKLVGLLLSAIDLGGLSKYVAELSRTVGLTVFILHGRDQVLAHPKLKGHGFVMSPGQPLPAIADIDDPRLQLIWREDGRSVISQEQMRESRGHYLADNGRWQVFIYGEADVAGNDPWLVGVHFDGAERSGEVGRFWVATVAGLVLLVVLTLLGMWLGHRFAGPMQRLVDTAGAAERLEFDRIERLPRSRVFEIDRAATAFNRMIGGLQVFQRYVPKPLVQSIMRQGPGAVQPQERIVTVMFADIVGFTALAEQLTPRQAAALLNAHFETLGQCVEATGGTVDKYIGDGLMAFWGAPEPVADHAARACRAALAIAERIEAAHVEGGPGADIRLRIGLHTGPVIVGDIGGVHRINYTVIGDTVNIADRIENHARQAMRGPVTILASDATVAGAGDGFDFETLGGFMPTGRSGEVVVSRLLQG